MWFRELPEPLLNVVPNQFLLHKSDEESECVEELQKLPEPNKSLILWLLDLMAEVASKEATSKMNSRNLGSFKFALNLADTF